MDFLLLGRLWFWKKNLVTSNLNNLSVKPKYFAPIEWMSSCMKFRFDLFNFKIWFLTLWFEFFFSDIPDRPVLNSSKNPTSLEVTSNRNTDHWSLIIVIISVGVVVCATFSYFVYKHRKYYYIRKKMKLYEYIFQKT